MFLMNSTRVTASQVEVIKIEIIQTEDHPQGLSFRRLQTIMPTGR
jgi:hypothetical protein